MGASAGVSGIGLRSAPAAAHPGGFLDRPPDVSPEPGQATLNGGTGTQPVEAMWTRFVVHAPTLLMPYRLDALIGTGQMLALRISFARTPVNYPLQGFSAQAASDSRASVLFPAGARGIVYLWAPGVWWVRCEAVANAYGTFKVPCWVVPIPDPSVLSYLYFDRVAQRCDIEVHTLTTATTTLKRAQEMLDYTALTVQARVTNAGTSVRMTWEELNISGHNRNFQLNDRESITFSGPTFPLADLNAAASNATGTTQLKLLPYA